MRNRFFKSFLASVLTIALCISSSSACAADFPMDDVDYNLNQTAFEEIKSAYPEEILFVEQSYNTELKELNYNTLSLIKEIGYSNLYNTEYEFSSLLTAIAVAYEKQKIEFMESIELYGRGDTKTIWDDPVVRTEVMPLRGKLQTRIPTNTTVAKQYTVSIGLNVGDEFWGYELTSSFSKSSTITAAGPDFGALLCDGRKATHNFVCGVLYGAIIETNWTTIDVATGKVLYRGGETTVNFQTSDVKTYSALAQDSTTVYVESPVLFKVKSWNTVQDFEQFIKLHPEDFFGNES